MNTIRSICVYCGSSPGRHPDYLKAAEILGTAMGEAGIRLVYGGGTKGLMGAVSDAVKAAGGSVTGIIPRFLMAKEATERELQRLDELIITEDMHERKHIMFERADAFVALPGGIGTLEELIEIMTWGQLGRHRKPIAIADVGGFWRPLAGLLDHMHGEGFIHTAHQVRPLVIERAEAIVPAILKAAPPPPAEGDEQVIEKL
ncbi:TIGR00730 family Rossman fold protein [Aurantimonas sp. MSK8Z-1]|uniref:LOG family protein n=1 Tax=Mangrovibrevibacter kandeliae TaxID=2968473 RepID=UPI0021199A0D|nr:TIGR00730 family Rossman fold protein [Aurantimonas sp. MSK8Z-1]MCW4113945.1 TIGR00730 family Rossman fold protein [Aurantimonas sp. MSK8Z-1]